jgi:hypothetical protein
VSLELSLCNSFVNSSGTRFVLAHVFFFVSIALLMSQAPNTLTLTRSRLSFLLSLSLSLSIYLPLSSPAWCSSVAQAQALLITTKSEHDIGGDSARGQGNSTATDSLKELQREDPTVAKIFRALRSASQSSRQLLDNHRTLQEKVGCLSSALCSLSLAEWCGVVCVCVCVYVWVGVCFDALWIVHVFSSCECILCLRTSTRTDTFFRSRNFILHHSFPSSKFVLSLSHLCSHLCSLFHRADSLGSAHGHTFRRSGVACTSAAAGGGVGRRT